ncbi:hypothetical protein CA85_36550 [Allorhodopirellula solitaria]|uniref:Uncharacterized protein n=1 Tax=Allorhodopirellula solitaria TaxID=2527987 RepID=A0A5C5XPK5_9BACT|nr:hypothetical protein CA85_36550 [Allorhodopirellula solitaria]
MTHQTAIDGGLRKPAREHRRMKTKLDALICSTRQSSFDEAENRKRLTPVRVGAGVRYQRGPVSLTQFQTATERLEQHCGSPPTKTPTRKVEMWLAAESQLSDSRGHAQIVAYLSKGFVNRLRLANGISFSPVPYICHRCSVLTVTAPLLNEFLQRRTLFTARHSLRSKLNEFAKFGLN